MYLQGELAQMELQHEKLNAWESGMGGMRRKKYFFILCCAIKATTYHELIS